MSASSSRVARMFVVLLLGAGACSAGASPPATTGTGGGGPADALVHDASTGPPDDGGHDGATPSDAPAPDEGVEVGALDAESDGLRADVAVADVAVTDTAVGGPGGAPGHVDAGDPPPQAVDGGTPDVPGAAPVIIWSPANPLFTSFGYSLALSGDTLVVGAADDAEKGEGAGAAFVFKWAGGVWSQPTKLLAADATASQRFGISVCAVGDTVLAAASSARGAGDSTGAGYVFVREGATWRQQAKIMPGAAEAAAVYGSYALGGDTLIASGWRTAPVVFARTNGRWAQQGRLIHPAVPESTGPWIMGAVAGDTAVVQGYAVVGDQVVYAINVFVRDGGEWRHQADLLPDDGSYIIIGVGGVAFDADTIAVAAGPPRSSGLPDRVLVFTRQGAIWTQQASLTSPLATPFAFGISLALGGGRLVVSEIPSGHPSDVSVRVFTRDGGTWHETTQLAPACPEGPGITCGFYGGLAVNDRHVAIGGRVYQGDTLREAVFAY